MTEDYRQTTPTDRQPEGDISLFEFGSTLLENRFRIALWAVALAVVVAVPSLFEKSTYTSTAMVVSTGASSGQESRLRMLASQYGLGDMGGGPAMPTASPAFLAQLASSAVILGRVIDDTVRVEGEGSATLVDLVRPLEAGNRISERDAELRRRRVLLEVQKWVQVRRDRDTEAIRITVRTGWPEVSHHLAERILQELNRFNLELGQAQARHERRFVEQRLAEQETILRDAERRLGTFLETNRQFRNSPDLNFEYDRLEREVALQQQVLVTLAQSQEEVRIREVRDTPVLTVVEAPVYPVIRDAKGRIKRVLLAFLAGAVVGIAHALIRSSFLRRREEDADEIARFKRLLGETVTGLNPKRLGRTPALHK